MTHVKRKEVGKGEKKNKRSRGERRGGVMEVRDLETAFLLLVLRDDSKIVRDS